MDCVNVANMIEHLYFTYRVKKNMAIEQNQGTVLS